MLGNRPTRSLLAVAVLCAGLQTLPAHAGRSLEQIRYELHKDPSANVEADLRPLAERGDLESKRLLADVLSGSGVGAKMAEAVQLYKEAFANGRGDVRALAGLARQLERNRRLRAQQRDYFRDALGRYQHGYDVRTVTTTLEVSLAYPEFFREGEIERLITLYQRSCLYECYPDIYRASIAEHRGDLAAAEALYIKAMRDDPRAVERYYEMLGDDRDQRFTAFAESQMGNMDDFHPESAQRIGSTLNGMWIEEIPETEEELDLEGQDIAEEGGAPPKRSEQLGPPRVKRQENPNVVAWLDNAIARGSVSAMIAKVNYMSLQSKSYSAESAFELIEKVEQSQPLQGKSLRASILMVPGWRTLDPLESQRLSQELIDAGYDRAWLTMGDLYSRGGLDEADQQKSLEIYMRMAENGSAPAFYRMANLYARGRAICHDKVKAYSYGVVAYELGTARARGFLQMLEKEMDPTDVQRARATGEEILKGMNL